MKKVFVLCMFLFLLVVIPPFFAAAAEDITIETADYTFRLYNTGDLIGVVGIEPKDAAQTPWSVRAFTVRIDENIPQEPQMVYFSDGAFENGILTVATTRGGSFRYVPETREQSVTLAYNESAASRTEAQTASRLAGLRQAYRSKRAAVLAAVFLAVAACVFAFVFRRCKKRKKA